MLSMLVSLRGPPELVLKVYATLRPETAVTKGDISESLLPRAWPNVRSDAGADAEVGGTRLSTVVADGLLVNAGVGLSGAGIKHSL